MGFQEVLVFPPPTPTHPHLSWDAQISTGEPQILGDLSWEGFAGSFPIRFFFYIWVWVNVRCHILDFALSNGILQGVDGFCP